jgi:hypothetical protein
MARTTDLWVVSEICVGGKLRTLAYPQPHRIVRGMASNRAELAALKNMIAEVDHILATLPPYPKTALPDAANCSRPLALTDDLISQAKMPAAKALGRKGGSVIAKRGSDYFRQLAARRKTHGGGRPRKESE